MCLSDGQLADMTSEFRVALEEYCKTASCDLSVVVHSIEVTQLVIPLLNDFLIETALIQPTLFHDMQVS